MLIHASIIPSLRILTVYDQLSSITHLCICYVLYLFILLDFMSNHAILGVTGEEPNDLAQEAEEEETPQ